MRQGTNCVIAALAVLWALSAAAEERHLAVEVIRGSQGATSSAVTVARGMGSAEVPAPQAQRPAAPAAPPQAVVATGHSTQYFVNPQTGQVFACFLRGTEYGDLVPRCTAGRLQR